MRSRFGFCTQNTLLFYELQAALYDLVNMPVLWTGFICVRFPVQCGGTDLGRIDRALRRQLTIEEKRRMPHEYVHKTFGDARK